MSFTLPSEMSDGLHRYLVRIYFEDTDAGGIVYHANYLRFAERGRTEALRDMGLPHAVMMRDYGAIYVVRRINLDYQRPARLDDWLTVETGVQRLGGASADLRQVIRRGDETLAVLDLTLVSVRAETGRAEKMPAPWREALAAMQAAAETAAG